MIAVAQPLQNYDNDLNFTLWAEVNQGTSSAERARRLASKQYFGMILFDKIQLIKKMKSPAEEALSLSFSAFTLALTFASTL